MDMEINYLGLKLPHPFIVGASSMVNDLDKVKQLEDAGASALVMNSLFEEQIIHQQTGLEKHIASHMDAFSEATSFFPSTLDFIRGPEDYLRHLEKVKAAVDIPVIGSLNGSHLGSWVEYATLLESAGADALELNLYFLPTDLEQDSLSIENRCVEIVKSVRENTRLSLAVKLSPFFSALPHFSKRLADAGANGLVLFNRYYQPDIDIENLEMLPLLKLSNSEELHFRLRWLGILFGQIKADLSLTGGVHTHIDAIKGIMAGATSVQIVSALLRNDPDYLKTIISNVTEWMEVHEYESIDQMRGSMSYLNTPNPEVIERTNYMKILQSWSA